MKISKRLFFILVYLTLIVLPYLIPMFVLGDHGHFVGFFINPIDGNSYLAKMQLGFHGSWLFELPYTLDPNEGAFLFFFYIFLGHIARWLGIPLILVFHIARIICAGMLLFSIERYLRKFFQEDQDTGLQSLLLTSFGSGMGWILAIAGYLPTDFWVAETYPFLSSFTNPHFTGGLAILIWILSVKDRQGLKAVVLLWILGIILAIIMPFGIVIAILIRAVETIWLYIKTHRVQSYALFALLFGGGVLVLYQYYVTTTDPILSLWNEQNITISPPMWDLALSLSPALLFCFIGLSSVFKHKTVTKYREVLIWLFCGLLLIYFPFSLQRRFLMGLYIPISIFAMEGYKFAKGQFQSKRIKVFPILFGFSILTNVLLVILGILSVIALNPRLVIETEEYTAMEWIEASTQLDARFTSSPEMGTFIPALTGRRVVYGHPFETVHAEAAKQSVMDFYSESSDVIERQEFLKINKIDYIFVGPREKSLGNLDFSASFPIAYQNNLVTIYEVQLGE